MIVLAIDTAGSLASVALCRDGQTGPERCSTQPKAHASHVLALVDGLLAEAGVSLSEVDRFAFGSGPGGLTGLRVAASVIQGFAYVFERPVVAVSNLMAMAQSVIAADDRGADGVFACHDAGMGQVVWAFYSAAGSAAQPLGEEILSAPAAIEWRAGDWLGVGVGAALAAVSPPADVTLTAHEHTAPMAATLAVMAAQPDAVLLKAEDAQPKYLRHPVNG